MRIHGIKVGYVTIFEVSEMARQAGQQKGT